MPLVIAVAGVLVWQTQYYVDYEVSLLPWLAGRGWVLYRDVVDQHTPLLTWVLSIVGGDPGWPLQAVIVALNVATLALVYFVAERLAGVAAGFVALVLAAVWLVSFDGAHLWFDGVLGLVYLGIMVCATCGARRTEAAFGRGRVSPDIWAFGVGLLLGVGVMVKQHAILAVPFALLWVWQLGGEGRMRRFGMITGGFALPVLAATAATVALGAQGALGDAWYWVVSYSLTSDYAEASRLTPGAGEWPVLASVYALAVVLLLAIYIKGRETYPSGLLVLLFGLVLAATLPAWPRYARFHLQGAVPLLAVAGGVGAAWLWGEWQRDVRRVGSWGRVVAVAGLVLVGVSGAVGVRQWSQALFSYGQLGSPQAPYAETIGPLRVWVDANMSPGAPIFVYNLDSLIYRVLEREPTRPFVPQLSWVLSARGSESRLWAGVTNEQPGVILAPAAWWDSGVEGRADAEGMLRHDYHEGGRFGLVSYPGATKVDVVGLIRNATPSH